MAFQRWWWHILTPHSRARAAADQWIGRDVLTWLLCHGCGEVVAEQRHRPLQPCGCGKPGEVWRVLTDDEVDVFFRLPPWELTIADVWLLAAFGIDAEVPEAE